MRLASAVAALCLTASYACAADLDCAQVKLIVPYPAGGAPPTWQHASWASASKQR